MLRRQHTLGGLVAALALTAAVVWGGARAEATHAWADYHWARTASPFTLTVVNSTEPHWDAYVSTAVTDWSTGAVLYGETDVLDLAEVEGSTSKGTRRKCQPDSGMLRICNDAYGYNGWLGVAGISIDINGHIVSGYTKLNDTYFNTAYYDSADWRQSVTCQELGHNVGLNHQDEDFNNVPLLTCMDYQDPPYAWSNAHDFEQLATIYGHVDTYDSWAAPGGGGDSGDGGTCNAPAGRGCNKAGVDPGPPDQADWGISMGRRGGQETFVRINPDGTRHVTFVTWAE